MEKPHLTFWFDFASTYSYLSAMRIGDMARDRGVAFSWQPFLLGPIFHAQGWDTSPFRIYPAKGVYMWRDMQRLTAARGLPFLDTPPDQWPAHSVLAARVAQLALHHPEGPEFCRQVYLAEFRDGAEIAAPATLATCLTRAGLSPALVDAATEPQKQAALRQAVETAQAKGIFGAPSFTVGDELFWGDDRLNAALNWAATS